MPHKDETLSPGFNIGNKLDYMLDRNYTASSRLNYQFYLWKESLQFNIHPSIPLPTNTTSLKIADLATGTAVWLLDLLRDPALKSHKNIELDGFDIDLSNAPDKTWLPSNITLRTWNIFDDVPDDLVGKYDIVHLRLLVLVVQNSNPLPIIEKAHKLLKPGGYIQWDDLNYPDTVVVRSKPLPSPACDSFLEFAQSNGRNDWVLDLPRILVEEHGGFVDARLFHFTDQPVLFKANGDQYILVMEEFAARLKASGMVEEARRIEEMIAGLAEESRIGAHLSMARVVCVARRAG